MSTRSPVVTVRTPWPTAVTVPTASCPSTRPGCTSGTSRRRMCRSVLPRPQGTMSSAGHYVPAGRDGLPDRAAAVPGQSDPVDGDGRDHAGRAGAGHAALRPGPMTAWLLRYEGWDPAAEALREALCALGNGRFVTRAAAPERRAGAGSYPGTYVAGVFDRLTDEIAGHQVSNESIVNLPDWQSLTFRIGNGPWLDLSAVAVTDYVQELDLRRGVLTRRFGIEDGEGRRTRVAQRRLVSMADPCLAALDCTLLAENWAGPLTVRSGLDGRVTNDGVARTGDWTAGTSRRSSPAAARTSSR